MNRKKREQLILDAAVRVFANRGYRRTNVSELVAEAKVARGTFYLYFKSKNDVFNCLIEKFLTELMQSVSKLNCASFLPGQELKSYIRSASSDLISCLMNNRLLVAVINNQANTFDREINSRIAVYQDQLVRIVKNNIESGVRAGLFRQVDAVVSAHCVIGAVREVLMSWVSQGDSIEIESRINAVIDYLLAGFVPVLEKTAVNELAETRSRHAVMN